MSEELFDIVDEDGQPTGDTVTRAQAHAEGIRHRTVHIWGVRENGDRTEVLLQKRALNKDSFPGRYDTSSAGHIQAGDEPLISAIRELSEELGIRADENDLHFAGTFPIQYEKEFHGNTFKDNEIAFVYVYENEIDIDSLTIQKEELDSVEWFDLEEVYKACQPPRDEKFCVPMGGLEIVRKYVAEKREDESNSVSHGMSIGMCIGIAIGTAVGAATDNMGTWMCIGMVLGMVVGMSMGFKKE
ncbi:MAG: NUDIX domain-containing protein [Lachnospiraceae bacterium]|nr:NUDIX domain-containing protein [Lachnospiraceae bacterium]